MTQAQPSPAQADRDRDWLVAIRAGDESAFAALFATFYEGLWTLVNEYVHAPDVAEEIVQDVFLRIWEQRARWQVHGSIRGYLYSAARSRALDYLRHQRVTQRWEATAVAEANAAGPPRAPDDLEARVAAAELSAALDDAIAQLPPALREVLTLRSRHHLTYPEIAGMLGISMKALEMRVTRAFKALRESLDSYLD